MQQTAQSIEPEVAEGSTMSGAGNKCSHWEWEALNPEVWPMPVYIQCKNSASPLLYLALQLQTPRLHCGLLQCKVGCGPLPCYLFFLNESLLKGPSKPRELRTSLSQSIQAARKLHKGQTAVVVFERKWLRTLRPRVYETMLTWAFADGGEPVLSFFQARWGTALL